MNMMVASQLSNSKIPCCLQYYNASADHLKAVWLIAPSSSVLWILHANFWVSFPNEGLLYFATCGGVLWNAMKLCCLARLWFFLSAKVFLINFMLWGNFTGVRPQINLLPIVCKSWYCLPQVSTHSFVSSSTIKCERTLTPQFFKSARHCSSSIAFCAAVIVWS